MMNCIYKVVWNKVRQTFVVCDENATCSGQSKARMPGGVFLVLVLGSLFPVKDGFASDPSSNTGSIIVSGDEIRKTVLDENTTITATETPEGAGRYSGIGLTDNAELDLEMKSGKVLTVNAATDSASGRAYGISSSAGTRLSFAGDGSFSTTATNGGQARVFRNYGFMTLTGDIVGIGKTDSGILVGAETWGGGTLTFAGRQTVLDLYSDTGRVIGVQNHTSDNGVINFNADKTLIRLRDGEKAADWFQGVLVHQASVNFTGDTVIDMLSVAAPDEVANPQDRDERISRGINVESDPGNKYRSTVSFSGNSTTISVRSKTSSTGVFSSGVPSLVQFTGKNVGIIAESSDRDAIGLQSQYGAHINFSSLTDLSVTAHGKELTAAVYAGPYAKYNGNIDIGGTLNAESASSGSDAFGIYNYADTSYVDDAGKIQQVVSSDDGLVTVGKNAVLTVTSQGGDALGVYGSGKNSRILLKGDVDIRATSTVAKAYGVMAEKGASVSVGETGKTVSISAAGIEANGIYAAGQSQISVNGNSRVDATVGILNGQTGKSSRGVYAETGSSIIFNGNTDVTAKSDNAGTSFPDRVYAAYAMGQGSTLTFNGDTTNLYASGKGNNVSYVDGLRGRNSGDITFNSRETTITAEQYSSDGAGLTAFGAVVSEGAGGNLIFNSDQLKISSRSNIRAQGLTLDGKWKSEIKKGDVIIEAVVSGNSWGTARNALGLAAYDGSRLDVSDAVQNMKISVSGSGGGYPNEIQYGATGIDVGQHASVNINSAKLDILADSGDLNAISEANAKPIVGIVTQDAEGGIPSFNTGHNTVTTVTASASQMDVYGVRADAGTVFFGGETSIIASTTSAGKNATGVFVGKNSSVTFDNTATVTADNALAGDGTVTKSGSGILTLNGGNSGFTGTFNQQGGETLFASGNTNFLNGATVNVSGGKLSVFTIGDGATISLAGSGTLNTLSDQVFKTGLGVDGATLAADEKRSGINVVYQGGTLALGDAKFNLKYLQSAESIIGSQTKLVMLGTLVDELGNVKTDVRIDELKDVSSTLAGVQVNTGNKNLVIGNSSDGSESLDQKEVGVGSLNLGDATEVTVKNGNALTLTGNGGSSISSTSSGGVTVKVGDGTENGILNLGSEAVGQNGQINGNIIVSGGSAVNVAGGTQTIVGQGITSDSGTVNVQSGATLNSTVALNNGAKLNVTGNLNADQLIGGQNVVINIGNNDGAGRVSAKDVVLGGAKLFLDPAWKSGGNSIAEASQGAFVFSGDMDGQLAVGQNSLMVLGDTSTAWAQSEFLKSGKTWGQDGITAALVIHAPVTLDATAGGSINVDGLLDESKADADKYQQAGNVRFADKSLLLVDAGGLKDSAAIRGTGTGTAAVENGAALHISNVTTKGATILEGFNSVNITDGWNGSNLTSADAMMDVALDTSETGKVKVTATQKNASDALVGIAMPNSMNAIWGAGLNDTASANAGVRFLSRAADDTFLNRNDAVRTINGAAQMAVAAGLQSTTITAAQMPQRAIDNHLSLTGHGTQKGTRLHEEGFDVWGEVIYNNTHASGFKAGSLSRGYNTDMGGFVVGGDYSFADNGSGKFRVGGAFNLGTGDSSSRGDFNHTKNDFDFWGINLYGGWNRDNLNVIANVGYSRSSNELTQTLPTGMQMGDLKADVDSSVLSVGLKGEYRLKTQAVDIIPHIGIRYLNVTTEGFTTKNNDGNLFHTDKDRQNIWQFPVGVAFTKDYRTENGWTIKPKLDLSIVPSTGDVDASTSIRVAGVSASDSITARVMDRTSFDGTLGVDMQKGNMTFGLRYGLQKSSNQTDQAGMATFIYRF